jgi:hypothetical protein
MNLAHLKQVDSAAPIVSGPGSTLSIAENTTAITTYSANESVTWSKAGTDGSFFSITSGGVLTIAAQNFEAPADDGLNRSYIVTVTAIDTAQNSTTQTLTVNITDVNEAPTITINSSAETHTITQAENISTVITYTASDVDTGASQTFSISGTDSSDFVINSASGVLAFASNPDFEAPADADTNNIYIVIITVSDGALSDTQTLTITITNINESGQVSAPTISGTPTKGIAITVTVSVNTAGKVRFFVGGKRISSCLSRPTSGTYPTLSATCSWKPAVTGRQFLTATLTPTDNTFSTSNSARSEFWVLKRSIRR